MEYFAFFCLVILTFLSNVGAEDYYELLGITKNADSREIRKAFKKLALELHPDKNKGDDEIHNKFLKINQAYEILKDEETRRKYDLYGDDGTTESSGQRRSNYQSWDYYRQNFGIYDDDPDIITLSKSDFERSVLSNSFIWFINFYSPMCSHCHHLAPTWREVSQELSGVVRIGAVNCGDEWALCRQQGIASYPSLMFYPDNVKYQGSRTKDDLIDFILHIIPSRLIVLTEQSNLELYLNDPEYERLWWLFFFCNHNSLNECPSERTQLKVAAMLDGFVNVAVADTRSMSESVSNLYSDIGSVILFEKGNLDKTKAMVISTLDAQEVSKSVLRLLPDVVALDSAKLLDLKKLMSSDHNLVWVLVFVNGQSDFSLELKKLPFFISETKINIVDCAVDRSFCDDYHVYKYPAVAVLKSDGKHEFFHDRLTAMDIASFVRESVSSAVFSLSPKEFSSKVINEGKPWFVDFYAPWCPPCLKLLPEWRKASRLFENVVNFGTVDCTIHHALCNEYNIRSYPTTILFNQSSSVHYSGQRTLDEIVEFVQDTMSPSVITLNWATFQDLVIDRSLDELWAVDFYAPWCGPCQQLSPQWRKMAKMFSGVPDVFIGQVDCTDQEKVCNDQGITAYPTLRVFPIGRSNSDAFFSYNGWNRDALSLRAWVFSFLPGSVVELDNNDFYNRVIYGTEPWIVDFYAPWCGHCLSFAPEFELVARNLSGKVKAGKVNCEKTRYVCHQAGIKAYPTVKFYSGTLDLETPQNTAGETISSQDKASILVHIQLLINQRDVHDQHTEL